MTNTGSHITTEAGAKATPYDFGAGQVTIFGPSSPGLVYETNYIDYLNFLCYFGFTTDQIRKISNRIPQGYACPEQATGKTYLISTTHQSQFRTSMEKKAEGYAEQ